jgi:hypothetical protein
VPRSTAFLARFFAAAVVLFALWSFAGAGDGYSRFIFAVANPFVWLVTGFRIVSAVPIPRGLDVFIRKGTEEIPLPLQPRELFSGIVPFLALMIASLGLSLRERARATAIGIGILIVFHIGLMLIGPYLATPHEPWINTIIDVTYGFYGLVGFVALPFVLWFWLTQRKGE